MKEKNIHFFSDGIKLVGTIYLPDSYKKGQNLPAVIANSGYTGLNAIYPRLFGQALTRKGYAVLGFDYRGCGESEGVKGRLILDEQVKDILNAIVFLKQQTCVDPDKIALLGWGMAGSLVVTAAAKDTSVKAVAALNSFFDGKIFYETVFSKEKLGQLEKKIEKDKINRVLAGKISFRDAFEAYPLDPDTEKVVELSLRPVRNYETKNISFEIAESIMTFSASSVLDKVKCPLFIGHGKQNLLHPVKMALDFYEKAPLPKKLYLFNGKHNDFMSFEHHIFTDVTDTLIEWLDSILK